MRALDLNATTTIRAPFDTDPEPTEFDIAIGITGAERSRLLDMNARLLDDGKLIPSGLVEFYAECVRVGLRGMRRFYAPDGKEVSLVFVEVQGRKLVADSVIEALKACVTPGTGYDTLLNWLGTEIWQKTTLTPDEKKRYDERLKSALGVKRTLESNGTTTTQTTETDADSTTPIN